MAWYHQPVKPYDPVIEDQQDNQSIRYYQDDFSEVGQDSHTEAPAQNQAMWEALTNIMPVTRGSLRRRRGTSIFSTGANPAYRLTPFQRDSDGLRTIVAIEQNLVQAFNEDGSSYNPAVLTTSGLTRMVMSRSYGYFFGATDRKKWDGNINSGQGTSNIGIPFVTSTGQISVTNNPSTATALNPAPLWQNPNNAKIEDGAFATSTTVTAPNGGTSFLVLQGFGFSIPSNATINGISIRFKGKSSSSPDSLKYLIGLTKSGSDFPTSKSIVLNPQTTNTAYILGSSSDLWGVDLAPSDLNSANFGVWIQGLTGPSGGAITFSADVVQVTVSYFGATNAPSVVDGGGGNVTLTVGRIYYQVFKNTTTGHLSDLGPASGSTGPLTSRQIAVSTLAISSDPQVSRTVLLPTADGGDPSVLYYVTDLPNGSTTFTDNTPEANLVLNQQYLFTDDSGNDFGVAGNTPPPTGGTLAVKHKGRLWLAVGQNLYFTKSVTELTLPNGFIAGKYEESWPLDQYLDISEGAELATGLLSNGQVLFIGTEHHVRWVTGDDPTNFSEPEVVHAEVGVLNQEVWQNVFVQGTPAGCIWVTPDHRVIMSDFNTYRDVGSSIQNVLDNINPQAAKNAHATFVTDGELDLYILAIPTGTNTSCDTHCVYNMNTKMWVIWTPFATSTSILFNVTVNGVPQWIYGTTSNKLLLYDPAAATDVNPIGPSPVAIPVTARTSWLHLGSPTHRKLLDELEFIGDSGMQITVEGASPETNFNLPTVYKNAVAPVVSPFGQLKVYLASSGAKDRYYRLTFFSPALVLPGGLNDNFLHAYNLKAIPFNTL